MDAVFYGSGSAARTDDHNHHDDDHYQHHATANDHHHAAANDHHDNDHHATANNDDDNNNHNDDHNSAADHAATHHDARAMRKTGILAGTGTSLRDAARCGVWLTVHLAAQSFFRRHLPWKKAGCHSWQPGAERSLKQLAA